ncbi:unnamed protein product [Blepharisma stoltei]|uniref:Importin subunit alpha n=1 Tax=Blepharisma stoltei TaxID=1481888 RepID=A0AAU9JKD9_9CILI|nr:unnamed protein product [Blepharisma stoltei]
MSVINTNNYFESRKENFMLVNTKDLQRKTEEYTVKLRKTKRTERFERLRLNMIEKVSEEFSLIKDFSSQTAENKLLLIYNFLYENKEIDKIKDCLKEFAKILIQNKLDLIELYRDDYANMLCDILNNDLPDEITSKAAWILCIFIYKNPLTEKLVNFGVIDALIGAINENKPLTTENSICALANICGDNEKYRHEISINYSFHSLLHRLLQTININKNTNIAKTIAFCISNLCRTHSEIPIEALNILWEMINLLGNSNDIEIIYDIFSALRFLIDNQNPKYLNTALDEKIIKNCIEKFEIDNPDIKFEILKLIASISFLDKNEELLKLGVLDLLIKIIANTNQNARRLVQKIISNLLCDKKCIFQIINHKIFEKVASGLIDPDILTRLEASYSFRNISQVANTEQILAICNNDYFLYISEGIKSVEPKIVMNLLKFVKRALICGEEIAENTRSKDNKMCILLDQTKCLDAMEHAQQFMTPEVYQYVINIFKDFFGFEDENLEIQSTPQIFEFS